MPNGQIINKDETWEHDHRWKPVNSLKNSRITLQIHCPDSGKRLNVPEKAANSVVDLQSYFDEAPTDSILGSTTLAELIKKIKKDIPALYLWDEVGGALLACGPHQFFQSEWDTTMIWELICEERAKSANGVIPHVKLDDGRDAIVVTIGTPDAVMKSQPTVVQRCLAKGDVYG
mmetsp:Transcript_3628/g.6815  ORF Transcript_3628/g.6815 Transcript_3628/m.6815 type:complete len:174 (-) Transcript_3628:134-655(-)|eukprot:CAMPEP_0183724496 /NCGR_PEP_ID=MMETSP0737-20130205/17969_1 /TAXON_ID=385413 /ORGANISM="Thalassiosira miniscula, Strain CCMP1093" /LENGTH=173 /DNA_ID=CAMNT_0025955101 /DNA_START=104 /DNA_END=625 /DNA_ORIENTATION=-